MDLRRWFSFFPADVVGFEIRIGSENIRNKSSPFSNRLESLILNTNSPLYSMLGTIMFDQSWLESLHYTIGNQIQSTVNQQWFVNQNHPIFGWLTIFTSFLLTSWIIWLPIVHSYLTFMTDACLWRKKAHLPTQFSKNQILDFFIPKNSMHAMWQRV